MKKGVVLRGVLVTLVLALFLGSFHVFAEPIKLTFLRFGNADDELQMNALLEGFKKVRPDVTVDVISVGFNEMVDKHNSMIAAGIAPDIVFNWTVPFSNLWDNGQIISLDDFIAKSDGIDFPDYLTTRNYTFDGHQIGIPFNVTAHMIKFNEQLFSEAGLPNPRELYYQDGVNSWNWDSVIDFGKKLTQDANGDGTTDQYAFAPLYDSWVPITTLIWSYGGDLFSEDMTHSTFDAPEGKSAIERIAELAELGLMPYPGVKAPGFDTGKLAMARQSAAGVMNEQRKNHPFDWDMVPYPAGPAGFAAWTGGNGLAISSQSKHPQAAWDFVRFVTGQKGWDITLEQGLPYRLPPRKSLYARSEVQDDLSFLDINLMVQTIAGENARTPRVPTPPGGMESLELLRDYVKMAVRGDESVDAALTNLKAKVDAILVGK